MTMKAASSSKQSPRDYDKLRSILGEFQWPRIEVPVIENQDFRVLMILSLNPFSIPNLLRSGFGIL